MTIVGTVSRSRVLNALVFFPVDYILSCFFRIIVCGYLPIELSRYVLVFLVLLCGYFLYTSSILALALFAAYMFVCCFCFFLSERRYVLSFGIVCFLFGDRWDNRGLFFVYVVVVVLMFAGVFL